MATTLCEICGKEIRNNNLRKHLNAHKNLEEPKQKKIRGVDYSTRPKSGAWNKGKTKDDCETLKSHGEKMKQKYLSGELIHASKGKKRIYNPITNEKKTIFKKDLESYINIGWKCGLGFKRKSKKGTEGD
jgi:hypothetical protein